MVNVGGLYPPHPRMEASSRVVLGAYLVQAGHIGVGHKSRRATRQVFIRQLDAAAPGLQRFHVVCGPVDVLGFIHAFAQSAIQREIGSVFLRKRHVWALHGSVPVEP